MLPIRVANRAVGRENLRRILENSQIDNSKEDRDDLYAKLKLVAEQRENNWSDTTDGHMKCRLERKRKIARKESERLEAIAAECVEFEENRNNEIIEAARIKKIRYNSEIRELDVIKIYSEE
ncbi:MAG: hypothetical protein MHMPM18_004613 [Marteilia pararefringens]